MKRRARLRLAVAISTTVLGALAAVVGLVAIAIAFWPAAALIVGAGTAFVGATRIEIDPKKRKGGDAS